MIFEQSKLVAVSNSERERKKAESVTDHPHADGYSD